MHIHLGGLEWLKFIAYLLIAGGVIRLIEYQLRGTSAGGGLAFLY